MFVKQIELHTFRNYKQQVIDAQPGINVFFGDNAQGKTNILEAVYLCACARSHRTARDSEMILQEEDQYQVRLSFADSQGIDDEIAVAYLDAVSGDPQRSRKQRIVQHRGIRLNRIGDMMGLFHAVIFAPEDLMLVKEGPATRRRYLDLLISQVRPSYFVHLQQFGQYLSQRNRLLKQYRSQLAGPDRRMSPQQDMQLDVWDQALADQAAAIIVQRRDFAQRINNWAVQTQKEISSGKEILTVKYKSIPGIVIENEEKELALDYHKKLKSMVYEDIERGITSHGPHRDDLELSLNQEGLKPYASQGQQRSAALALKLAELQILREEIGESPVLLLDDVMSELDEHRRTRLLSHIEDAQVFVTCTDASQVTQVLHQKNHPDSASTFTFFRVEQGTVVRVSQDPCIQAADS